MKEKEYSSASTIVYFSVKLYTSKVGFTQIVLQFVDFELKVRLVQRSVHQKVVSAEVNEVKQEGDSAREPQLGPRGHEQQRGAEEAEQKRGAQSDFVPPQRHAELH